jgi:hypothetical protein
VVAALRCAAAQAKQAVVVPLHNKAFSWQVDRHVNKHMRAQVRKHSGGAVKASSINAAELATSNARGCNWQLVWLCQMQPQLRIPPLVRKPIHALLTQREYHSCLSSTIRTCILHMPWHMPLDAAGIVTHNSLAECAGKVNRQALLAGLLFRHAALQSTSVHCCSACDTMVD